MKILFIAMSSSPDDKREWSGTVHQAFRGLERAGFDVTYLCALRDHRQTFLDKLLCAYWLRVPVRFGKRTRMDESWYTVRVFKQTLSEFDYSPYDIIFVPTHIAVINALPNGIKAKIVHLVDATVDALFDYYTEFSNLWFHNYWEAHVLGKRAFRRADLVIASSDWCCRNAIMQYGIPKSKIEVVEFGANIDADDIPTVRKDYSISRPLRIFWCGVNWQRKGGDVAVECCRELVALGNSVELHIAGIDTLPDELWMLPWVVCHGFLDKNNPEEYANLINIMTKQDIFLFPSRAECSSIALCEANAFGLPCFVYDTGGTANYVNNGQNGFMLPLSASAKDFADKIMEVIDAGLLEELSVGALKKYQECLNWNKWSERVGQRLRKLGST